MPDTDNGRVTLAVVSEQIAQMQKTLEEIRRTVNSDHDCLISMTAHQKDTDKKLEEHEEDIEILKKTGNTWNGVNTALAIAGSTLAAWLGLNK